MGGPSLPILFLLLFLTTVTAITTTIYDHLRRNDLPIGLLPKGITEYRIDPSTGEFQVNLTEPCNAKFETQFYYDFRVSGVLSFGKMGNVSGVSQKELFLWLPVKGIRVDVPSSGLIYFDVGVVDKQFSLSLFEIPVDCSPPPPPPHVDPPSPSENQQQELARKTSGGDNALKASL